MTTSWGERVPEATGHHVCSLIQLLQEEGEEEGLKEGHRGPQLLTALNKWAGEAVFQELTVQFRGREEITEQ